MGRPIANGLEAAKAVRRAGEKHLVIERLSRDRKPECKGELERIATAGGVVFPLPGETGGGKGNEDSGKERAPLGQQMPEPGGSRVRAGGKRNFGADVSRLWKPGCDGPGLAMNRSIGDKVWVIVHLSLSSFSSSAVFIFCRVLCVVDLRSKELHDANLRTLWILRRCPSCCKSLALFLR